MLFELYILCDIINKCRVFCGGLGWWLFIVFGGVVEIDVCFMKVDVFVDNFVVR